MASGKLKNGFEFHYEDEVFDDMELMESLAELTEIDNAEASDQVHAISAMGKIFEKVLGKKQKAELYDSIRKDGRVPMADVAEAFQVIVGGTKTGKKS